VLFCTIGIISNNGTITEEALFIEFSGTRILKSTDTESDFAGRSSVIQTFEGEGKGSFNHDSKFPT
jgi:hypothetical protein